MDKIIGNVDVETAKKLGKIDDDTKWELVIKNQRTGAEVIHLKDIKGGVYIAAQDTPSEENFGGTRQGIFGALPFVMVCYYKSKFIIKQTLKKYLGEDKFKELDKHDAYKDM